MRLTTGLFMALLTLALSIVVTSPVQADVTEHQPSPADQAAFRNFTLTDELFNKYMAVEKDIAKDPCRLGLTGMLTGKYEGMSLDEMTANWQASPGVREMLANHDITAKQMVLTMITLLGAAFQDLSAKYPQASSSNNTRISEANMAFYHAHKAEIRQQAQERGRKMVQANDGKTGIPSCMQSAQD